MVSCYISFGSNQGDRHRNIRQALKLLKKDPAIKVLKISSLIETDPVDACPQPRFINGVAKLQTNYSAQQLLQRLQQIEVKLGRSLHRPKNQRRTIDLDILLYGDLQMNREDLQIPHPRMWEREFVTVPLKEIAPELFKQNISSTAH